MINEVLETLNDGNLLVELETAMRELVADVKNIGKPGSLSITIQVKPQENRDDVVIISDKVKVVKPEFDRRPAIFFVSEDNELVRHDPRQKPLFQGGSHGD